MKTKITISLLVLLFLAACSVSGAVAPPAIGTDLPGIGLTLTVGTQPPAPGPGTTTPIGPTQYMVIGFILLIAILLIVVVMLIMNRRQQ